MLSENIKVSEVSDILRKQLEGIDTRVQLDEIGTGGICLFCGATALCVQSKAAGSGVSLLAVGTQDGFEAVSFYRKCPGTDRKSTRLNSSH